VKIFVDFFGGVGVARVGQYIEQWPKQWFLMSNESEVPGTFLQFDPMFLFLKK
jgi:hypothetical protein